MGDATSASRTAIRAVIHEQAGGFWAEVPELPGCFTQGDTLDEVYHNLREAVACHLDKEVEQIHINLLEIAA